MCLPVLLTSPEVDAPALALRGVARDVVLQGVFHAWTYYPMSVSPTSVHTVHLQDALRKRDNVKLADGTNGLH